MKLLVLNPDLPLDALHAALARFDGQGAPSRKDIFGTEHKLGGRVAVRPQDAPHLADCPHHQLDATQACAG
jgi:hypothetical protein